MGNILLSSILGAELFLDDRERQIEDKSPLADLVEHLRQQGTQALPDPGRGIGTFIGEHGICGLCLWRSCSNRRDQGLHFDYVVHCTGSGSTQAGLVAGFAALGTDTRVIGVSDDNEVEIKRTRALRLANETLETLDLPQRVGPAQN